MSPPSAKGPEAGLRRMRLAEALRSPAVLRMAAVVAGLHVLGWGVLLGLVAPQGLTVGLRPFLGLGVTAYVLGLRHAFDADHIAAIDNTTRQLMARGRRPLSTGFWFSLGHSSVVFALTILVAFGVRSFAGALLDAHSSLRSAAGVIGAVVSGGFLYAIAALNLLVLADLWRASRRPWTEGPAPPAAPGGLVTRLLKPVEAMITRPWQMYVVGLLFGLGFDTVTEIALLALSGSGAAAGAPWYAVLCLPVLFAAGMSLMDGLDGVLISQAYAWSLAMPGRGLRYNLVVTTLSVAIALGVGGVEILGLLGDKLGLKGALWRALSEIDLTTLGVAASVLLLGCWLVAATARRLHRSRG